MQILNRIKTMNMKRNRIILVTVTILAIAIATVGCIGFCNKGAKPEETVTETSVEASGTSETSETEETADESDTTEETETAVTPTATPKPTQTETSETTAQATESTTAPAATSTPKPTTTLTSASTVAQPTVAPTTTTAPQPEPTATPTPVPTATPIPEPTATPTPTPVPEPLLYATADLYVCAGADPWSTTFWIYDVTISRKAEDKPWAPYEDVEPEIYRLYGDWYVATYGTDTVIIHDIYGDIEISAYEACGGYGDQIKNIRDIRANP